MRELKILRRLHHPYIIELFDIVEPRDLDTFTDVYLVLDLAESDLKKVLKSGLFLTISHVKLILYNLLCALCYTHSAQVLHRDLKPANVLIDEHCRVKLCDFGLARSIAPKQVKEELKEEVSEEIYEAAKVKYSENSKDKTSKAESTNIINKDQLQANVEESTETSADKNFSSLLGKSNGSTPSQAEKGPTKVKKFNNKFSNF